MSTVSALIFIAVNADLMRTAIPHAPVTSRFINESSRFMGSLNRLCYSKISEVYIFTYCLSLVKLYCDDHVL